MKKVSYIIGIIRVSAAFLIWSTGVFIRTFLGFPVQENKSAELSLEFFSSVPLAE